MQPLLDILKKLGGWPVLEGDNWKDGDFNWKESVYRFRDMGYSVDYFLDFSVGVDLKNSSMRTIDVSRPGPNASAKEVNLCAVPDRPSLPRIESRVPDEGTGRQDRTGLLRVPGGYRRAVGSRQGQGREGTEGVPAVRNAVG